MAASTSASSVPTAAEMQMQKIEEGLLTAINDFFSRVAQEGVFSARVLNAEKHVNVVLPTFQAGDDSLFGNFLSTANIPIKLVQEIDPPEESGPALLMHDLENPSHKEAPVYKHISKATKENRGSALYGTSGIGKTRSIYEYLSHNKGFLFIAADHTRNGGSTDLYYLIQSSSLSILDSDKSTAELQSATNMSIIALLVIVLLFVRVKIHNFVEEETGRQISPHEWLLLQLYPNFFFGGDIFQYVFTRLGDLQTKLQLHASVWQSALSEARINIDSTHVVPFVDEAQTLLEEGKQMFLTSNGEEKRCMYYALLRALNRVPNFGSPVFSGTRLSINDLKQQSASGGAGKKGSPNQPSLYFLDFETLDNAAVKSYIAKFLNVVKDASDDDIDEDVANIKYSSRDGLDEDGANGGLGDAVSNAVMNHVCKWLRGRPRWTASFLETFLDSDSKRKYQCSTRGEFDGVDSVLIEALDRYIKVMTNPPSSSKRRFSWSFDGSSAWECVSTAVEKGDPTLGRKLENAVIDFAIGKTPTFLKKEMSHLIIHGVAAVLGERVGNGDSYSGIIEEPIVVQAGLKYFEVGKYLRERMQVQDDQGGNTFEKILLPSLLKRNKFDHLLATQLKPNVFEGFWASPGSSYGTLVLDCRNDLDATLDWIKSATEATFEGQVAPFCYPHESFGPDVIFLLWNEDFAEFRSVLCQAKFREDFTQIDALRTLVPDWLLFQNRDKEDRKPNTQIPKDIWTKWVDTVQSNFISEDKPCLRLMVQYPMEKKRTAKPGPLPRGVPSGYDKKDSKNAEKLDYLVVVAGTPGGNGGRDQNSVYEFFDGETEEVLSFIKKNTNNKRPRYEF